MRTPVETTTIYALRVFAPDTRAEAAATYLSKTPFQPFAVGDEVSPYTFGERVDRNVHGPDHPMRAVVRRVVREVGRAAGDDEVTDTTWIYLEAL